MIIMNIVLTGFMGTGKTAVGRKLAERLNMSYIDTDEIIEQKTNMKIKDIFATYGEGYFRDIESEVIKEVSNLDKHVISVGGGAVLRASNMDLLEKNGIVINLTASPETIYKRTQGTNERPLLNKPNPLEEIKRLLAYREPYYKRCSFSINTDSLSIDEIVEQIIKRLPNLPGLKL